MDAQLANVVNFGKSEGNTVDVPFNCRFVTISSQPLSSSKNILICTITKITESIRTRRLVHFPFASSPQHEQLVSSYSKSGIVRFLKYSIDNVANNIRGTRDSAHNWPLYSSHRVAFQNNRAQGIEAIPISTIFIVSRAACSYTSLQPFRPINE